MADGAAGAGVIHSSGYNLFTQDTVAGSVDSDILGGDPDLQPLADNGGPTRTHALGSDSDAVNAGDPSVTAGTAGVPATDQCGAQRVTGTIDIGAVEMSNSAPVATDDAVSANAATVLAVAASGVLANDTDADDDTLTVTDYDARSTHGAAVIVYADGSFTYDPTVSADLQALAARRTVTDTFTYTVSDGNGGTATATVTIILVNWRNVPMDQGGVEIVTPCDSGDELLRPGGRVITGMFDGGAHNACLLEGGVFTFQFGEGGKELGYRLPDDLGIKDGDGSGHENGNSAPDGRPERGNQGPVSDGLHDQLRQAAGWFEQERAAFVERL